MNTSVSPKVGVIFKSYEPLSAMQAYARQTEASNMSGGFWIAEAYHWFRQYGLESRGCFTTLAAVAMARKTSRSAWVLRHRTCATRPFRPLRRLL